MGMHKKSNMTTVYHLKITHDKVLLVHETLTHNVMYGAKFRAQDALIPSCPVDSVVKSAVDAKTIANSKAAGLDFACK